MKNLTLSKQNDLQILENDRLLLAFINAMLGMDEQAILGMLKPNKRYFKKWNAYQTICFFKQRFKKVGPGFIQCSFKQGIALNDYPGAPMIEFNWAAEPFNFDELEDPNPLESSKAVKLVVLIVFDNGKIDDLRFGRIGVEMELKNKMIENN